jgi:hypothetical protein
MSTTNAVKAPSPAAGGPPAAVPDLECVESRLDRIQWLVDRLVKSVDMGRTARSGDEGQGRNTGRETHIETRRLDMRDHQAPFDATRRPARGARNKDRANAVTDPV